MKVLEHLEVPHPNVLTLPKRVFLLLILLAYCGQVLFLIFDKSATTDEVSFHMVNGYAYLKVRDFRMSPSTPPLAREWMALPWFFLNPRLDLEGPAWREADSVPFSKKFLYEDHRLIMERLLILSRMMTLFLGLGLAGLIFLWSRALYGSDASLLSLFLFAFCPTLVSHSALAGVDLACAFFYFGSVYFLWKKWEKEKSSGFPWIAAILLGLGLATKYTLILLLPVFLFLCVHRTGFLKGLGFFLGILLVALGVTWPAYFFEWKPLFYNVPRVEEKIVFLTGVLDALAVGDPGIRNFVIDFSQTVPIPLSTWILGLAGILRGHRTEYLHFIMGRWTETGVWYHYVLSFLLKTTLPFLCLLGWRKFQAVRSRFWKDRGLGYLMLPVLVLFLVTFFDSTGVGIRYLIPAFPFFFVWIGGLVAEGFSHLKKGLAAGVILLTLGHGISALSQFPNSLAFFNILAGGPEGGYRFLRGSDADWGQELKNLKRFLDREGITHVRTDLFGTRDEAFYGIPSTSVTTKEFERPEKAVYAISVNHLDHFSWTKDRKPGARIGNAIFIFDLRTQSAGASLAPSTPGVERRFG